MAITTGKFILYDSAFSDLIRSGSWDNSSYYAALISSSYSASVGGHSTWADVESHEITSSGYGAVDLTGLTSSLSQSILYLDADDVNFGSEKTFGPMKYMVVVSGSTSDSGSSDRLLGYQLLNQDGSEVSSSNQTVIVQWPSSSVFTFSSSSVSTYDTITELYDDIDNGFDGFWEISWSNDAYIPDGRVAGTVSGGVPTPQPLLQGVILPSWLFESSDWLTGGTDPTLSFDSDNRPILGVTAATNGELKLNTRYNVDRFFEMSAYFTKDLGTDSTSNRWGLRMRDPATKDNRFQVYLRDETGDTLFIQSYLSGSPVQGDDSGRTEENPWVGYMSIVVESHYYDDSPALAGRAISDVNLNYTAATVTSNHTGWRDNTVGHEYQFSMFMTTADTSDTMTLYGLSFSQGKP